MKKTTNFTWISENLELFLMLDLALVLKDLSCLSLVLKISEKPYRFQDIQNIVIVDEVNLIGFILFKEFNKFKGNLTAALSIKIKF